MYYFVHLNSFALFSNVFFSAFVNGVYTFEFSPMYNFIVHYT